MTVAELIDLLDGYEPDTEVRLAFQPKWPFEYTIGEVVSMYHISEDWIPATQVVYIGEGEQIDYLSGEVANALGWS